MMKLLKKIKTQLSKQISKQNNSSDKQMIVVPLNEKVINPIAGEEVLQQGEYRSTAIHKVILMLNNKLNVFGVGEVTSYELNSKGELVMSLSFYDKA